MSEMTARLDRATFHRVSTRPTSPRIDPLAPAARDDEARELLATVALPADSDSTLNIFATLVRHPGLFRRWLPFGGKLLAGKLPARDRELMILRTAWRTRAEYEWGQHVVIARSSGVADDEIARVRSGPDDGWTEFEAALLRAVDELHDDGCISDATWRTLVTRYDARQLIEVPMLVGHYHMVGFTLNSLGVQLEHGVPGFDA